MSVRMETRKSGSGSRQTLPFLLVALIFGALALVLLGPLAGYLAFLLFGALFVAFFAGKKRQRLFLFLYLLLAVGLFVGGWVHVQLGREAILARLDEFPLLGSFLVRQSMRLPLAVLAGILGAVLGVGGTYFLLVLISVEWVLALRESYDLSRPLAIRLLVYLVLGIGEPYFIVENGEIVMTKPKGPLAKFGEPVVVVIKPYNAVVFERSGDVTRVSGPGVVPMRKHERIKEDKGIIDLRPQGEVFDWRGLTKDNVPLTGKGFLGYRIESWESAKERGDRGETETRGFGGVIKGQYPVFERTIYRAAYKVRSDKDWKSQTIGMAQGQVGGAVRNYRVDEIFVVDEDERVRLDESTLAAITETARESAVETARLWGVEVNGLSVVDIEMPPEAQKEFLERWGAPWRGWQALVEAKSDSARMAILTMAQSQAKLVEGEAEAKVDRTKAEIEHWKVVKEAEGRRLAAEHEGEIKRISAISDAEAHRRVAEIDAETARIKALEEAETRALVSELETWAERIEKMGEAVSRWEVAHVDAETASISARGKAQARALSAELESLAERIAEMGKAMSRREVAELDAETARIEALEEAETRALVSELEALAERIAKMGKAVSRWEVARVDAETESLAKEGEARAKFLAADLNSLAEQVSEVGKAVSRWRVAEFDAETEEVAAKGKARAQLEAAKAEAEAEKMKANAKLEATRITREAIRIEGEAVAEAEARFYRNVVSALIEFVDERDLARVLNELVRRRASVQQIRLISDILDLANRGASMLGRRAPRLLEGDDMEEAEEEKSREERDDRN